MALDPRRVPLVDLGAEGAQVADEVGTRWGRILASARFLDGPETTEFEEGFGRFCQLRHCVTVASGTDALELALRAVGVGPDSEVIVPAFTFIATALAVLRIGARPVLVDVDPAALLDTRQLAAALTSATRAVVPVHLYGQLAPIAALVDALGGHDINVVEDGAQAHGARHEGQPFGVGSAAVATSFYPSKNLGAYGHGGAVLTDDPDLAAQVRALRSYGSDRKYHHRVVGWNSHLDELQAAVLNAKLPMLTERNRLRGDAAGYYDRLLAGRDDVVLPVTAPSNDHVWYLYTVGVPQRDRLFERLGGLGIEVGIHYPVPLHLQPALRSLGYKRGDFPGAEALAGTTLSLPLFPTITPAQQDRVVAALDRSL